METVKTPHPPPRQDKHPDTEKRRGRRRMYGMVAAFAAAAVGAGFFIAPNVNLAGTAAVQYTGTEMSLPTRWANHPVSDPVAAIKRLADSDGNPTNRVGSHLNHPLDYWTIAGNTEFHVQSIATLDRGDQGFFHVLSHSGRSTGKLMFFKNNQQIGNLPTTGRHHPGGMQVVGDYLFVGFDAYKTSPPGVYVYDLTPLFADRGNPRLPAEGRRVITAEGGVPLAAAASVPGDVRFGAQDQGWSADATRTRYVVAIPGYGTGRVALYVSDANVAISDPQFTMRHVETLELQLQDGTKPKYDGGVLVSEPDGSLWLIGMRAKDQNSKQNWLDAFALTARGTTAQQPVVPTHSEKLLTQGGNAAHGVNFRWGGHLAVLPNDGLRVEAVERDIGPTGSRKVYTNTFHNF